MKGQTIIEVLIALATAVVVASAVTLAVLTSLRNAQYAKNQNIATQYAQEGMEHMRVLRTSNYGTFSSYPSNTSLCLAKGQTVPTVSNGGACGQNVDIFIRKITIVKSASSCAPLPPQTPTPGPTPFATPTTPVNTGIEVHVFVLWSDDKCPSGPEDTLYCHKVEIVSCLSDYTVAPTP